MSLLDDAAAHQLHGRNAEAFLKLSVRLGVEVAGTFPPTSSQWRRRQSREDFSVPHQRANQPHIVEIVPPS